MATIAEPIAATPLDSFTEDSKALIESLKELPTQAARILLATATVDVELESLRKAARDAGFTLSLMRNSGRKVEGDNTVLEVKLGKKIEIAPGIPRKPRAKKGEADAKPTVDAPAA